MAKGSGWERDVCKFLSKWMQGTEKPYLFWRGRGSGGMFTTSNGLVGDDFSGDVYSTRPESSWFCSLFSVECKDGYPSASFDKHLKYNKADPLYEFWKQTTEDARKSNKKPLLIYKKKGLPTPWVGITEESYGVLKECFTKIRFVHLRWVDLDDMYFFEMKEFFKAITPEIIKTKFGIK